MIYTVKNHVVENPEIVYNDGVTSLYLYTDGKIGGSESLHSLLKFFKQTNESNALDSELQHIQSIISEIKHSKKVGERYMTMGDIIDIEKEESYKEGYNSGYDSGLKGTITICRKLGKSNEEIIELLMAEFSLTPEVASNLVTNN